MLEVKEGWGADIDNFYIVADQQVVHAGIIGRDTELLGDLLSTRLIHITHGDNIVLVGQRLIASQVRATDPQAHDTDADFVSHNNSPTGLDHGLREYSDRRPQSRPLS